MADPDNLRGHIMHTSASIILGIAYGHDVLPKRDPIVKMVEETASSMAEGFKAKYLVNILPIRTYFIFSTRIMAYPISVRHVPSWFPGGGFKKIARETAELAQKSISEPFEWTLQRIVGILSLLYFLGSLILEDCRDSPTLISSESITGGSRWKHGSKPRPRRERGGGTDVWR